jgi:hypothetical protein
VNIAAHCGDTLQRHYLEACTAQHGWRRGAI